MIDDCIQIDGGRPLAGWVQVAGAKNAALPIMAAAILSDAPVEILNVPEVGDVATMALALARLGMKIEGGQRGVMRLVPVDLDPCEIEADLAGRMRASICLLGPLVARRGRAVISLPGGCRMGPRPFDLHLAGLRALGARVRVEESRVIAEASRLRGAVVDLLGPHGPTVTGTANVLSAAVLAEGRTTILNAAREPEVGDLGRFLRALGARIDGLETSTITVEGIARLDLPASHRIPPDRIEAATFCIAALATRGRVAVHGACAEHLSAVLDVLRGCGAEIAIEPGAITVGCPPAGLLANCDANRRAKTNVTARPFPGLPTDVQPLLAALCATLAGPSYIRDRVFPKRFAYAEELAKFGAEIRRVERGIVVRGRRPLVGAKVAVGDLRAGAALAIAALAAEGSSILQGRSHIDRGYQQFPAKLQALGAVVTSSVHDDSLRPLTPAA